MTGFAGTIPDASRSPRDAGRGRSATLARVRFAVRHHTRYRYDVPVRLASHVVRLTPRPDIGRLDRHTLRVWPSPVDQRTIDDDHGNRLVHLEFDGECRELQVESRFELDTLAPPPPAGALCPLPWEDGVAEHVRVDPRVRGFAEELCRESGPQPVALLDHLCQTLYTQFDRHIRHSGDANPAAETLATRRGACRDLAVLFMEAVRSMGMQTRFVSGYQAHAETVDGQRHLHAWPEVRLPGVGFRGWDPTHGVRVGEGHVALCAGPSQASTMPIEGGFYCDAPVVNSTLDFSLEIVTGRAAAQ